MTENEKLIMAIEEHKRRHPETEDETLVALGRQLYPKEEQKQRGSHALKDQDRERREAAELAKVRTIIAQTTQEPYKSREQQAEERRVVSRGEPFPFWKKLPNFMPTGIFSEVKASKMAEIAADKEQKRGV